MGRLCTAEAEVMREAKASSRLPTRRDKRPGPGLDSGESDVTQNSARPRMPSCQNRPKGMSTKQKRRQLVELNQGDEALDRQNEEGASSTTTCEQVRTTFGRKILEEDDVTHSGSESNSKQRPAGCGRLEQFVRVVRKSADDQALRQMLSPSPASMSKRCAQILPIADEVSKNTDRKSVFLTRRAMMSRPSPTQEQRGERESIAASVVRDIRRRHRAARSRYRL